MPVRFALLLLILCPPVALSAVTFDSEEFGITLGLDWVKLPLRAVDHVAFLSKSLNTSIKVLCVPAKVREGENESVAHKFLDFALRTEKKYSEGGEKIETQWVSPRRGDAIAGYAGVDKTARSFRWIGFVRQDRSCYLYVESRSQTPSQLKAIADDAVANFRY